MIDFKDVKVKNDNRNKESFCKVEPSLAKATLYVFQYFRLRAFKYCFIIVVQC